MIHARCQVVTQAPANAVPQKQNVIVGDTCKPAVNTLAELVGTGTGPASVITDADCVVGSAASLSAVLKELPARMRSRARRNTITTAYAVAGFDPVFGRMIVHVFQSPFFAPELTTFFRT